MNDFEDMQRALVTRWGQTAALNGVSLHFGKAPAKTAYPYAVFMLSGNPVKNFAGGPESIQIQFNVFSDAASSKTVNDALAGIKGAMGTKLTLTDHAAAGAPKQGSERIFENDSGHWQGTIFFNSIIRRK